MKFLKLIFITLIVLVALGYGVYYFGTNLASEKLMDAVSSELVNTGEMETIKHTIESDPELKALLENPESVDESTLPFKTKEEATKVLVRKIGINELQSIQSQVQEGTISKEELLQELQGKFSEEEITALKVIAYKELYKK